MQPDDLKAARRATGMTQEQFAEAIGLSRKTIVEMERGRADIEKRTQLAALFLKEAHMRVKMMVPGGSWIGYGSFPSLPRVGEDIFLKGSGHHTVHAVMYEGDDNGDFSPLILITPVKG